MPSGWVGRGVWVIGVVGLVAACSPNDPAQSIHATRGIRVIQEVIAPQMGLGPLTAECVADDDLGFGDTFVCEATTSTGQVVRLVATVADGGAIDMLSLNVLTDDVIGAIEIAAIDEAFASDGTAIVPSGIQCGDGPLVIPGDDVLSLGCRVLLPTTGRVHLALVEVTNLQELELTITIAPNPE